MARKRKSQAAETLSLSEAGPSVGTGYIPPRRDASGVSVGVHQDPEQPSPRKMRSRHAAEESSLFPKGGSSFENWCASKGISERDRRSSDEWSALLEEFANRPIYGLRRGPEGGDHRPNQAALRR